MAFVEMDFASGGDKEYVPIYTVLQETGIAKGGRATYTIDINKNYVVVLSLNYGDATLNNRSEAYYINKGILTKITSKYSQSSLSLSGTTLTLKNTNANNTMGYMIIEVTT